VFDGCGNLAALHRLQAERLGPRPALRYKRHGLYHDLPWDRYRDDALACAAALAEAGIACGDRVGLLAENRLEWLIADLGILAAGAVNVPPHAPLTARQVLYQLADAGCRWLFVSTTEQLDKVRQVVSELPDLKGVVLFDTPNKRDSVAVEPLAQREFWGWRSFIQRGRRVLPKWHAGLRDREAALASDDLATIMYTSGTTGNPKGVMLTHGNLLSNVTAALSCETHQPDDVHLSWLPYSHIYARTMDHYLSLASGALLCLAESAETLVTNLNEVQPTHMNAVPRFYEKIWTAETTADPEETKRRLRRVFGARVRWLCSGGAPLPVGVAEAYRAAGLLVLQGYGLTESSPVISFNRTTLHKIDSVGPPLPGVEVRIADDGEVLTRGPHVMKGYWHNPAASAEALRDGWLHTGDLGRLDQDGFLYITGRKKELLVLSNGKKVVPNYIEGLLLADPLIDQALVCGEARNFLTALIVPHWHNLRQELRNTPTGLDGQSEEALSRHPAVAELLQRRLDSLLRDVSPWERVKKIAVLPRAFTVAGDELTVSLKLRRNIIVQKYAAALDALYQDSDGR
jgi:long-chain acyl-CoA synthetase